MTNDELNPNDETRKRSVFMWRFVIRASSFVSFLAERSDLGACNRNTGIVPVLVDQASLLGHDPQAGKPARHFRLEAW